MFSKVLIISLLLSTASARPVPREDSTRVGNILINKQAILEKVLVAYQNGDSVLNIFKETFRDDVMDGIAEGICEGSIAPLIASLIAPAISSTGTKAIQKVIQYFTDEAKNWSGNTGWRNNYEIQPIIIEGRGSYLMLSSTQTRDFSTKNTMRENDTSTLDDLGNNSDNIVKKINLVPTSANGTEITTHTAEADKTIHHLEANLDTYTSTEPDSVLLIESNADITNESEYNYDKIKNTGFDGYVNDLDNEIETRTTKLDIFEDLNITRLNNAYLIPFLNENETRNEENMSVENALWLAMILHEAVEKLNDKARADVFHELEEVVKKLKTVKL